MGRLPYIQDFHFEFSKVCHCQAGLKALENSWRITNISSKYKKDIFKTVILGQWKPPNVIADDVIIW